MVIYYYFNNRGLKLHSPNLRIAHIRASFYGTNKVYEEKL